MKKNFKNYKLVLLLIFIILIFVFNTSERLSSFPNSNSITVLLVGFGVYGDHKVNTSWQIIKEYYSNIGSKEDIEILKLPVSYRRSSEILYHKLEKIKPNLVIVVGMGRRDFLEDLVILNPVAVNLDHGEVPDVDSRYKSYSIIREKAPVAYWSKLPLPKIKKNLEKKGIKAKVLNFGGSYLCNHVFYELMHYISEENNIKMGGFLHLPIYNKKFPKFKSLHALSIVVNTSIKNTLNKETYWPPDKLKKNNID